MPRRRRTLRELFLYVRKHFYDVVDAGVEVAVQEFKARTCARLGVPLAELMVSRFHRTDTLPRAVGARMLYIGHVREGAVRWRMPVWVTPLSTLVVGCRRATRQRALHVRDSSATTTR